MLILALVLLSVSVVGVKRLPHEEASALTEELWRMYVEESAHAQYLERVAPSPHYEAIYAQQVKVFDAFLLAANANIARVDRHLDHEKHYNPLFKQELRTKIYDLKVKFYRLIETLAYALEGNQANSTNSTNSTNNSKEISSKGITKEPSKELSKEPSKELSSTKEVSSKNQLSSKKQLSSKDGSSKQINNSDSSRKKQMNKKQQKLQLQFDSDFNSDDNKDSKKSLTKNGN